MSKNEEEFEEGDSDYEEGDSDNEEGDSDYEEGDSDYEEGDDDEQDDDDDSDDDDDDDDDDEDDDDDDDDDAGDNDKDNDHDNDDDDGQDDDAHDDEGSPDFVFVGSLSFETKESDLCAHLESLSLKAKEISFFEQYGKSKGCALVKFESEEDAQTAISALNHTTLNDREIFAREDRGPRRPRRRRRRTDVTDDKREPADPTYLYVGNIVYSVTSEELRDLFSKYGSVVEATISQQRRNKKSLGWGIVQFETKEEAVAAMDLNHTEFRERALRVEALEKAPMRGRRLGTPRRRENVDFEENPCHLYVGNLAWSVESDELRDEFSEFGDVVHAEVAKDRNGRSRGWGSVEFQNKDDAAAAMEDLQGKEFFDRPFNIQIRTSFGNRRSNRSNRKQKSERGGRGREPRERDSRRREVRVTPDRLVDNPKCHLFVGNLPWSVDDDDLADLFGTIGEVVDAIVTKDPRSKRSRGWGIVEMAQEKDANKAVEQLHEFEHLERRLLVRYDSFVKLGDEDCD